MSRSSKKGHDHAWLRRIGVLGRSRAKHATLPASCGADPVVSGLPCVAVEGGRR